jgi:hypothetical protein
MAIDPNNPNFHMANAENLEEIITAVQYSLIDAMIKSVKGAKDDGLQVGMTWEQIEFFLKKFRDKKPTVIVQEEPL